MKLHEIQHRWLQQLEGERGLAQLTIKNYQRLTGIDIEQLDRQGVEHAHQLTRSILNDYLWGGAEMVSANVQLRLNYLHGEPLCSTCLTINI